MTHHFFADLKLFKNIEVASYESNIKPRPLAVIRNRRLNSVALLDPLRSVQFSSVQHLRRRTSRPTVHLGKTNFWGNLPLYSG